MRQVPAVTGVVAGGVTAGLLWAANALVGAPTLVAAVATLLVTGLACLLLLVAAMSARKHDWRGATVEAAGGLIALACAYGPVAAKVVAS